MVNKFDANLQQQAQIISQFERQKERQKNPLSCLEPQYIERFYTQERYIEKNPFYYQGGIIKPKPGIIHVIIDYNCSKSTLIFRIKDEICSLINANGGQIFFASKRFVIGGGKLEKEELESIQRLIHQALSKITPPPEIDQNIFITTNNQQDIEGSFILRMMVRRTKRETLYSWMEQEKAIYSIRLNRYEKERLEGRRLTKYIKKRFLLDEELLDMPKAHNAISTSGVRTDFKNFTGFWSFESYEVIKQRFQKHGVIAFCLLALNEQKRRLNLIALYHDESFQQFKDKITSQFPIIPEEGLIQVEEYIKLQKRSKDNQITREEVDLMRAELNRHFPGEKISIHEYPIDSENSDYFMKPTTKQASLYAFTLLQSQNEEPLFRNLEGYQTYKNGTYRFSQIF